jgi:hypothetical protein
LQVAEKNQENIDLIEFWAGAPASTEGDPGRLDHPRTPQTVKKYLHFKCAKKATYDT